LRPLAQEALVSATPNQQVNTVAPPEVLLLSYEKILDGDNPRGVIELEPLEELKQSILQTPLGLLQPITVRPKGSHYELVAGARRRRAMFELHEQFPYDPRFAQVPAIVRDVDDAVLPIVQLVENLHREDLTAIEVADAVAKVLEHGMTSEADLARQLGWSDRTLKKYTQLNRAPGWLKELGKYVEIPKKRLDGLGKLIVGPQTGKARIDHDRFAGLPFTFLMELTALHGKLAKYDKERSDEDGSHKPKARALTQRVAFSAAREDWGFAQLQEETRRVYDTAIGRKTEPTRLNKPVFTVSAERLSIDLTRKSELTDTQKHELAAKATAVLKSLGFQIVIISLS
jgi:ParB/RepB/Spo0J family partition protein